MLKFLLPENQSYEKPNFKKKKFCLLNLFSRNIPFHKLMRENVPSLRSGSVIMPRAIVSGLWSAFW
jgi:hypothetical protein